MGDKFHTAIYADDTVLTISNKLIDTLQRNLTAIYNKTKQYCIKNDLVLNEKTSTNGHQQPPQEPQNYSTRLKNKINTKHLGIIIVNKLSRKPQIDKLCKKLPAIMSYSE